MKSFSAFINCDFDCIEFSANDSFDVSRGTVHFLDQPFAVDAVSHWSARVTRGTGVP